MIIYGSIHSLALELIYLLYLKVVILNGIHDKVSQRVPFCIYLVIYFDKTIHAVISF